MVLTNTEKRRLIRNRDPRIKHTKSYYLVSWMPKRGEDIYSDDDNEEDYSMKHTRTNTSAIPDNPDELLHHFLRSNGFQDINDTHDYKKPNTPLELAMQQDNIPVFDILLSKGADVNPEIDDPLLFFLFNDKFNINNREYFLTQLIKKGVNVNDTDSEGMTPLMAAYSIHEPETKKYTLMKLLLDAGANPSEKTYDGVEFDYLLTLIDSKDSRIKHLLKEYGAQTNSEFEDSDFSQLDLIPIITANIRNPILNRNDFDNANEDFRIEEYIRHLQRNSVDLKLLTTKELLKFMLNENIYGEWESKQDLLKNKLLLKKVAQYWIKYLIDNPPDEDEDNEEIDLGMEID